MSSFFVRAVSESPPAVRSESRAQGVTENSKNSTYVDLKYTKKDKHFAAISTRIGPQVAEIWSVVVKVVNLQTWSIWVSSALFVRHWRTGRAAPSTRQTLPWPFPEPLKT